jgi:hypothetical protein
MDRMGALPMDMLPPLAALIGFPIAISLWRLVVFIEYSIVSSVD